MTPFNLMQIGAVALLISAGAAPYCFQLDWKPGVWVSVGWLSAMMPLTLGYILTKH